MDTLLNAKVVVRITLHKLHRQLSTEFLERDNAIVNSFGITILPTPVLTAVNLIPSFLNPITATESS